MRREGRGRVAGVPGEVGVAVRGQPGVSPGLGAQVEDDRRPGAVLRQVRQVSRQLGVLLASS